MSAQLSSDNAMTVKIPPTRSSQHRLVNQVNGHEYLVQISRPINWEKASALRQDGFPVVYILDGNAVFLTASEICWRNEMSPFFAGGGIIVAISYPREDTDVKPLYNIYRRSYDYTPPTDRVPQIEGITLGGASTFVEFLERDVKPFVKQQFPNTKFSKEALFGHSFGGLCALHALFTEKTSFDTFFAASPSIWWDEKCILKDEQRFFTQTNHEGGDKRRSPPTLVLSYGSLESSHKRNAKETDQEFEDRIKVVEERQMVGQAKAMYERLKNRAELNHVTITEFEDEDHGTVVTCALNRCLSKYFQD